MKIISFPHYTCGGLLCDIMNNTFSSIGSNGGIDSIQHSIFKIGDSDSVYTQFDKKKFLEKISLYTSLTHHSQYYGTHCWLGDMDFNDINVDELQVINVTTVTYKSRLYRWTRAWYHYYIKSAPWQNLSGLQEIDKQRSTAKNYLLAALPIHKKGFINVEFADIVENKPSFLSLVRQPIDHHMERWKKINDFLYMEDLWTAAPSQRFYEAEYEELMNQYYVYS